MQKSTFELHYHYVVAAKLSNLLIFYHYAGVYYHRVRLYMLCIVFGPIRLKTILPKHPYVRANIPVVL